MDERLREAITGAIGGRWVSWFDDRHSHPDGFHRLANLVPEFAPDQVSLARGLAQWALENRDGDLDDPTFLRAYRKFNQTRGSQARIRLLAKEARSGSPEAWQACELFLPPENRSGAEWNEREQQFRKIVEPIPQAIQELIEDHFCGRVRRPKLRKNQHARNELRDDAIRFTMWMALESDLTATGTPPNAAEVVSQLVGISESMVIDIWKGREHKQRRERRA